MIFFSAFAARAAASAQTDKTDATDLIPTLRLTFDEQSLANTGSGKLTFSGGTQVYVESDHGYALDVSKCAPYGTISGVFGANRDSAIAVLATLGVNSTGIILHFKNGNTSIMLRRGAVANQLILTENNSSAPLITVNDIEDGDTKYHLYVVNILQNRVDLYVDGELAGTTATTPRAADLVNWQFGGRHGGVISGEKVCSGQIDDLRVYSSALNIMQLDALASSFGVGSSLAILPIPDYVNETFSSSRPEFVVSNKETSVTYTIGGDIVNSLFDVEYKNNYGVGEATVTVVGKGEYDGEKVMAKFNIIASKMVDENISSTDTSVRRLIVGDKYVYIFNNADLSHTVTANRGLVLCDFLLAGGGGGGGNNRGGGGGAGGVTNSAGTVRSYIGQNDSFTFTVGAGGAGSGASNAKGGNGGATTFEFGDISLNVPGGGGGGSWNAGAGVSGASGGGGAQNAAGGTGIEGFGFAGANGAASSSSATGGGGGAGHAGYMANTSTKIAGNGGEGVVSSITGDEVYYGGGGGGGGGTADNYEPGIGGNGGGGNGSKSSAGKNGVDGFGGGGGGGGGNSKGGNGGSGVVIIAIKPAAFEILPISQQIHNSFDLCCPQFVVSNCQTAATLTLGGDIASPLFDVVYENNEGIGTAKVSIIGKGEYAGEYCEAKYEITSTKLEDENISTTDISARRLTIGGKSVYIFTDTSREHTVTANRNISLTDYLLVGGGGGGGRTMGGGGGGGGVAGKTNLYGVGFSNSERFTIAVGSGGDGSMSQNLTGGNGGNTSLKSKSLVVDATGGGGGGSWGTAKAGARGGSGGGGANGGGGGTGEIGLGYAGAASLGANNRSGGGGGAGHAGYKGDSTANHAGYGGEGVSNNITGAWVVYGGGGGAGGSNNGYGLSAAGLGGLGGGGDGSKGIDGKHGTDGLGGGGGGGGYGGGVTGYGSTYAGIGGNGGSGVAILAIRPAAFVIDSIPDQMFVSGGNEPLPVVYSSDGARLLVKDTDYTLSYTDNDKSGIALVTITGIGEYAGKSATFSFKIFNVYYADPDVELGGDGTSWATAMSVSNAIAAAAAQSGIGEVWIKADTLSAPAIAIVNNANLTIRGGFAGTETTLAERQLGALTVFDGKVGNTRTSSILLSVENAAGVNLVIERIKFRNAKSNGFVKTGGGSLTVLDCVIEANGRDVGTVYGRGLNAQSDGSGSLVVSNCIFAGNRCVAGDKQYGGFGLYAKSFKSALVDNSLFVTNGYDLTVQPGKSYAGYLYARGSALYAENTPITVRGCRFAGNNCPIRKSGNEWCGGTIALEGACGGSIIENCALIGNSEYQSADENYGAYCGGAIAIRLSSILEKATVRNCTIAYNITQSSNAGGGITVARGDVDIENTILWQNRRYKYTAVGFGSDVQLQTDGRASIRHSFVTTMDGTALVGANLTVDEDTVFAVDPQLVTSTATFESLLTVTDAYQYYTYTNPTIYEDLATMDAHLLSAAGYCINGGAVGPATSFTSTAIDMGDPGADCANEPAPNGGRLNLGAYANTLEASKSVSGQPKATVEVSFPDSLTRPVVRITMGLESGLGYTADVRLICSTGNVAIAVNEYNFVSYGDVIEWKALEFLQPGATFNVEVVISSSSASTVTYNSQATVTGEYPPYYGKGGGAHVIHVREGADCKMDGTSWTDAFPNIKTALLSIKDDSKTELWLSVTNDHLNESTAIAYPLTIRGGFAGVENSPNERLEGSRSILDGRDSFEALSIKNSAAVSIERLIFKRGLNSGLIKSGEGDLYVSDCHFLTNGMDRATVQSGKGARVSGAKATTVVTFSNCLFRCNRAKPGSNGGCSAKGGGINASNLKCLRLEDSTFINNGIHLRNPGGGNSYEPSAGNTYGSAIYSTVPISAVGCLFKANFCQVLNWNNNEFGNGGTVRLHAGAEGSAFTNCAWVANGEEITWPGNGTGGKNNAGALTVMFGSREGTIDVNNCTFAYNLTDGYEVTAGLNIILGTANVRNSIFFGNIIGGASKSRGRDISLRGDSVLNVAYTMFGEEGTNSITCAETATTNFMDGVVFGDPLFMTPNSDVASLVKMDTETAVGGSKLIFWDWTTEETYSALENINVHLRSNNGYIDKNTGKLIKVAKVVSPAIDAGDPKSDYSREPNIQGVGYHGRRVNLGAYGNTSEAALTRIRGFHIIVR